MCEPWRVEKTSKDVSVDEGKRLWGGNAALVCEGTYYGVPCAAKGYYQLIYENGLKQNENRDAVLSEIDKELRAQIHMKHPNIAPLWAVVYEDRSGMRVPKWLLSPNYDESLHAVLHGDQMKGTRGVEMTVTEVVDTSAGMLRGLIYLHEHGQTHLHLKPKNVLLDAEGPHLADFNGLKELTTRAQGSHGLQPYDAPEADGKGGEPYDAKKGNVFSFGIMLVEMLMREECGRVKANGMANDEALEDAKSRAVSDHPLFAALLEGCLAPQDQRLSAPEVLAMLEKLKKTPEYLTNETRTFSWRQRHESTDEMLRLQRLMVMERQKNVALTAGKRKAEELAGIVPGEPITDMIACLKSRRVLPLLFVCAICFLLPFVFFDLQVPFVAPPVDASQCAQFIQAAAPAPSDTCGDFDADCIAEKEAARAAEAEERARLRAKQEHERAAILNFRTGEDIDGTGLNATEAIAVAFETTFRTGFRAISTIYKTTDRTYCVRPGRIEAIFARIAPARFMTFDDEACRAKLESAVRFYGGGIVQEEDVLVLLDTSFWGSAKQGYLVTSTHFAASTSYLINPHTIVVYLNDVLGCTYIMANPPSANMTIAPLPGELVEENYRFEGAEPNAQQFVCQLFRVWRKLMLLPPLRE